MADSSVAAAVEAAVPSTATTNSAVQLWRESSREKRAGVVVLLAIGLWSLYKFFAQKPEHKKNGKDGSAATTAPSSDDTENSITSDAAADLRAAATGYDRDYQDRMKATTAVPAADSKARPFIGFSLADNIVEGALIVDGVFVGGPADQTGIDIDHELLSIHNTPATSIDAVRQLVATHCRPGQVTRMRLRKADGGAAYEVMLWIMTTDDKYRGKPYFFDTSVHEVRQSEREKQTWSRETSPKK